MLRFCRKSWLSRFVGLSSAILFSTGGSSVRRVRAFSAPVAVSPSTALKLEETVCRYFQGVNDKDPGMIRSCFGDMATIRDVCGINDSKRTVPAQDLVDRCMDFLAAHPDCMVQFHYGPECGRSSNWVVAHWYETGTWSGESCGLAPSHQPMTVEGQTRFLVDPESWKITDFVVTRTFTDWEQAFLEKQKQDE